MQTDQDFDALLVVSFGGPEGPDDVMPFLENVLRGKNIPRERMLEVVDHYAQFDGVSPINDQNRKLIAAIKSDFASNGVELPIYWGNRNWHPMLPDTLRQMKEDGVKNALAFFTSMFSCYSGCRQYHENISLAQSSLGAEAPEVQKIRMAFNHPRFIAASVAYIQDAIGEIQAENHKDTHFVFTAHSIPMSMAEGCNYSTQLNETCRLIMDSIGPNPWNLVYQSRSGPPTQPWLEPDVCDFLTALKEKSDVKNVVMFPVGFISDHIEVLFDLDTEANEICEKLGINLVRAKTVGTHPEFVEMIRELVLERTSGTEIQAIGCMPANWNVCPKDCCTYHSPARTPLD